MKNIMLISFVLLIVVGCGTSFHKVNNQATEEAYMLFESKTSDSISFFIDELNEEHDEGQAVKKEFESLYCMALTIYKEVRGEPESAQIRVAQVVMNRVNDVETPYFDNTVCDVMKKRINKTCMFSFWCDKKNREYVDDKEAFRKAELIASKALEGKYSHVTNATYFKNCSYNSRFFNKLKFLGKAGKVCFYKEYASR